MRTTMRTLRYLAVLLPLAVPVSVWAQSAAPDLSAAGSHQLTAQQRRDEVRAAWQAAVQASTSGPADVTLIDQAHLHLQPDTSFIPPAPATRLLRAWGNIVPQSPVGLVVGMRREDNWAVVIRFIKEGYIKDDDAKDWNADDLLKNLRDGTAESNEQRRENGFPELEIVGWIAKPAYDSVTHRLVWSLAERSKDAPADAPSGINYNTYALGRDGYFSLNLLTDAKNVDHDRVAALALLAGLDYDVGKRYQDFEASTDHVAAYGLAALVGVVALKKLGLLALGAAFFLKFAKVGLLAMAAIGAVVTRIFRRKKPSGGAA